MESTPFFSVVMAIQNGMPYLKEAMKSIRYQSFGEFEIIVVDDHSSDDTVPYLKSLNEPRLRIIASDGIGQTHALNVGIQAARAEWVVRMDGDDWCDPQRFALQKAAIATSSTRPVMVTSDYLICDEDLRPVAPVRLERPNSRLKSYLEKKNNPFCHPTVVFHRPTALDCGLYDTRIRNAQDYHLWLRLLSKGSWAHVPALLVHYRVRRGSLSVLYQPEQTQDRKSILKGHEQGLEAQASSGQRAGTREVEAIYHYKLGFSAWVAGRRWTMLRHLIPSMIESRTFRLKALALSMMAILPRRLYLTLGRYRGVFA